MYSGPDLPANETAIVRGATIGINIESCDGKKVTSSAVSVLPGDHVIEMSFSISNVGSSRDTSFMKFTAEAGHTYGVDVTQNTGPGRYTAFIMDATSGKRVSDNIRKPGGDWERLALVEKSLKEHPKEANFWAEKGTLLNALGRYDEAISALDVALSLKADDNGQVSNQKGISLYRLKRYDESLIAINKAISLGPDNAQYKQNKEKLLKTMEDANK